MLPKDTAQAAPHLGGSVASRAPREGGCPGCQGARLNSAQQAAALSVHLVVGTSPGLRSVTSHGGHTPVKQTARQHDQTDFAREQLLCTSWPSLSTMSARRRSTSGLSARLWSAPGPCSLCSAASARWGCPCSIRASTMARTRSVWSSAESPGPAGQHGALQGSRSHACAREEMSSRRTAWHQRRHCVVHSKGVKGPGGDGLLQWCCC